MGLCLNNLMVVDMSGSVVVLAGTLFLLWRLVWVHKQSEFGRGAVSNFDAFCRFASIAWSLDSKVAALDCILNFPTVFHPFRTVSGGVWTVTESGQVNF